MKKLGILFATIIMAMLFAVSASALEPTGQCGDDVYWTFNEDTGELVISGSGDMWDYDDYDSPFYYTDVQKVVFENGVTSIGEHAFMICKSLTEVSMSDDLTRIGLYAFFGCSKLKSVSIPHNLKSLDGCSFYNCSSLSEIIIPDSVIGISGSVFENTAYYNDTNNWIDSVLYIGKHLIEAKPEIDEIEIKDDTVSIATVAFLNCDNIRELKIPDSVVYISQQAIQSCDNLKSVTIGKNLEVINIYTVNNCENLKKVYIPKNVCVIADNAFSCKNLSDIYYSGSTEDWEKINIGSKNQNILNSNIHYEHTHDYFLETTDFEKGKKIYSCECGNTYIEFMPKHEGHTYTSKVTKEPTHIEYGERIFICECGGSYIENIRQLPHPDYEYSILNNKVTITDYVGSETDVVIPSTIEGYPVTTIDVGAFWYSDLNNITIPKSVISIGKNVFGYCENLENIVVEEGNKYYCNDEYGVLYNIEKTVLMHYPSASTNLEYVIPDKVTTIDSYAFGRCESLNKITLPLNCKTTSETFNCTVSDVYYPGTLKEYLNTYSNITHYSLHCSDGTYNGYKGTNGDNVIWVFDDLSETLYIMGNGEIDYDDIYYSIYYDFKHLIIEEGITEIYCTFGGIEKLETVTISASVEYMEDISFASCKNLKKITVDEDNKYYSNDEYGVLFDKNKTVLYAYPPASSMKSYTIPNGVKRIVEISFSYCKNLKNVVLPDSLTKIDQAAFENCTSLETIMIPDTVAIIYQSYYCENLTDVFYEGSEEQWNAIEIYDWSNNSLINAKKHFNHSHKFTIEVVEEATHLKEGKGIYSCECGYIYTGAIDKLEDHAYTPEVTKEATHLIEGTLTYTCECGASYTEPIAKLEGHTYTSEVTKESTHLEEGEKTYTCECGDSYAKPITKLEGHTYTSEITKEATHLEEGTLTYTCECGDSYTEPIAKLEGHTYISEVTKEATHIEEGVLTYSCECGDSYTESIEKIEKHTYIANVIAPTCSEKGYTLNVCECGDSYISDYVGMIAHSYAYSIIKLSTHISEGLGRYTCSECGDHYDEPIAKTKEHSYTSTVVDSTCTEQGYTLNECECGESYKNNYLAKIDHSDANSDGVCDNCGYDLTENCSCNCHKGGIAGFFFKLILFFQKLFRTNQICEGCGTRHY